MEFTTPTRDSHLPGTGAVAAFALRGACVIDDAYTAPSAAFTGLHEALRRHEHRDNHAVLLTTFTPMGAAAFSTVPLRELTRGTTALAHLIGDDRDLRTLQAELNGASNHATRVASVDAFFRAHLRNATPDPLVLAAVQWLRQYPGQARIRDLALHIGLSQSALERRFHHSLGVSPKKFAMLVRLQRVIKLRKSGVLPSTIAHTAGYFDHSHFINDFQRIAGKTPEQYFADTSN